METKEFSDQTVVVTGATRGIGRAICFAFLKAGAKVIGTYHSNEERAEQCLAEAREQGFDLAMQRFDVGNYQAVETFFKDLEERGIQIQVVVNNSGVRKDSVMAMMSEESWIDVMRTNLDGCYHMSKFAVHNMMKNRYGRIIQISSPMSRLGFAGQANYAASKAGIEGLTRSLSKEVASRGITVNCVSPGFIATDLIADLDEAKAKEYKKLVPMKRFGTPEEVADAVMFLASKKSAYISGTILEVSGGIS